MRGKRPAEIPALRVRFACAAVVARPRQAGRLYYPHRRKPLPNTDRIEKAPRSFRTRLARRVLLFCLVGGYLGSSVADLMPIIEAAGLTKTYRVFQKKEGFLGAVR